MSDKRLACYRFANALDWRIVLTVILGISELNLSKCTLASRLGRSPFLDGSNWPSSKYRLARLGVVYCYGKWDR